MNRVSVLIGAGATIELDGPSTSELTQKVISKKQEFVGRKTSMLKSLNTLLSDYYSPNLINFEHLLHLIEMLQTYHQGWKNPRNVKFKPPIIPFIKSRYSKFYKEEGLFLLIASNDLIRTVAEEVHKYDEAFRHSLKFEWYKKFWQTTDLIWDIATLNYDTTIEYSLNNQFMDGFEDSNEGYYRFNPNKLISPRSHTVAHLHGCILYGHPRSIGNKYAYEDLFQDVYKFDNYEEAKLTWFGRSSQRTQASEESISGPIITGLRKLEKLNSYPYGFYHYYFQKSILENQNLLIVGYGLGDLYVNHTLHRINRIHANNKKVVIITFYSQDYWHEDHRITNFPESHDAYLVYARLFEHNDPWQGYKRSNFEKKEPIKSKNGNVLVYINGFRHAVENHGDDIISFLKG